MWILHIFASHLAPIFGGGKTGDFGGLREDDVRVRGSPEAPNVGRGVFFVFRLSQVVLSPLYAYALCPSSFAQPSTPQVLTLISLCVFGLLLTLLLIYILDPDKEPLPWRAYCAAPELVSYSALNNATTGSSYPLFNATHLDDLPPAGLFVGVFSIDSAFERRMLIRTTWASHPRSRNGASDGDGGAGTSRTVVRFILGQPRKDYERRIKLEMDSTSRNLSSPSIIF